MFESSGRLKGLLPAVISGGRPTLASRPTSKLLETLHGVTADPVWIVRSDQAGQYEPDGHEIAAYSLDWARGYAHSHWTHPEPPQNDFFGAFPGREAACREAERRGCWGVLQLDDNIAYLQIGNHNGRALAKRYGLVLFAEFLAAVTLSTNSRMTGAQLGSVPAIVDKKLARQGFPYSLFIERVGGGREEWHGPYEDDITHALQYAARADFSTASVLPYLRYCKESGSKTGMRGHYQSDRARGVQMLCPEGMKIGIRKTRSSGRGGPRVFHTQLPGALKNPLIIKDKALFSQAEQAMKAILNEFSADVERQVLEKLGRK
jgi:hypothetical protein